MLIHSCAPEGERQQQRTTWRTKKHEGNEGRSSLSGMTLTAYKRLRIIQAASAAARTPQRAGNQPPSAPLRQQYFEMTSEMDVSPRLRIFSSRQNRCNRITISYGLPVLDDTLELLWDGVEATRGNLGCGSVVSPEQVAPHVAKANPRLLSLTSPAVTCGPVPEDE
uniref:Uncharacterized protein n=1 Tax=Sphaerodactylus townsendi TaxID=933632 RepID=A0ACB8ETD7_9SAUR